MGLIGRVVEREGISTVGVSTMLKYSELVLPPRTMFLKWPMGHALGEPDFADQHKIIIKRALNMLQTTINSGVIEKPPYRWKRHEDLKIPY